MEIDFGPPYFEPDTPKPEQNEIINNFHINALKHEDNHSYDYIASDSNGSTKSILKFFKLYETNVPDIKTQIQILDSIKHPNIVESSYFRYKEYICIATPLPPEDNLHTFIHTHYPQGVPEELASKIMFQMIAAVEYLHSINICHCDIKLDSFLVFDSNINNISIKLTNFSYAQKISQDEKIEKFHGTPEYCAPEVFKHIPYDAYVDIWSLGVALFVMLSGIYPFPNYRIAPKRCREMIMKGEVKYDTLNSKNISADAINLVSQMCQLDPVNRISSSNALRHCWISSHNK